MLSLCSTVPPHTDRTHCGRQKPSIRITELRNRGTNPYYTNSLDDLKQSLKLDPKYIKACMIGCAWRERFLACITKLSLLCWWALPHINNQRSSPVAVIQQHTAAYHLWSFQSPSSPNQVTRSWRKSMHWGSVQFWAAGSVQAWARLGQLHTMASEAHRRPLWTLDFLYFRFARSSNQNQNRDEVGIYFQCSCIAYPSLGYLGCYSKRLDGKIVRSFLFLFFHCHYGRDSIAQFSEAVAAYDNGLALDPQRRGPSAGFEPKTRIQNPLFDMTLTFCCNSCHVASINIDD